MVFLEFVVLVLCTTWQVQVQKLIMHALPKASQGPFQYMLNDQRKFHKIQFENIINNK